MEIDLDMGQDKFFEMENDQKDKDIKKYLYHDIKNSIYKNS